jgi:hypothetical protein
MIQIVPITPFVLDALPESIEFILSNGGTRFTLTNVSNNVQSLFQDIHGIKYIYITTGNLEDVAANLFIRSHGNNLSYWLVDTINTSTYLKPLIRDNRGAFHDVLSLRQSEQECSTYSDLKGQEFLFESVTADKSKLLVLHTVTHWQNILEHDYPTIVYGTMCIFANLRTIPIREFKKLNGIK